MISDELKGTVMHENCGDSLLVRACLRRATAALVGFVLSAAAARDRKREAEKRIQLANAGTLSDKLTKHSAERAADEARVVIARGRAMIRELGGDPPPPPRPRPKDPPHDYPGKNKSKKHKPDAKKNR